MAKHKEIHCRHTRIKKINFWSTSFYTTIATLMRLVAQFVVAKCIAVFSGASAFGVFGQFLSFVALIQLVSGGVIRSGVVKYASEYHDDPIKLKRFLKTSFSLCLSLSVISGILIAALSVPLSQYLFHSVQYHWVLILFGMCLTGYTLNQLFVSICVGLNKMKYYMIITVVSGIASILLTGLLTYYYHTAGTLTGYVLSQMTAFIVSIIFMKGIQADFKFLSFGLDGRVVKKLMKFSLMTVVSLITYPLAQLLLRNYVAHHSSWQDVGYWQAMLKISDAYLLVVTTIISTYALPTYSRLQNKGELKQTVHMTLLKVIPLVLVSICLIFACKKYVILILFSRAFLPMGSLFLFQLLGDLIKVAAWVIGNVQIAKAKIKTFIIFQVIFTSSYFLLSITLFDRYGIDGLTLAFFINLCCYLVCVYVWFRGYMK